MAIALTVPLYGTALGLSLLSPSFAPPPSPVLLLNGSRCEAATCTPSSAGLYLSHSSSADRKEPTAAAVARKSRRRCSYPRSAVGHDRVRHGDWTGRRLRRRHRVQRNEPGSRRRHSGDAPRKRLEPSSRAPTRAYRNSGPALGPAKKEAERGRSRSVRVLIRVQVEPGTAFLKPSTLLGYATASFEQAARRCALNETYRSAQDESGHSVPGTTPPFSVHFSK